MGAVEITIIDDDDDDDSLAVQTSQFGAISMISSVCVYCFQVLYLLYFHRDSESESVRAISVTELLVAHPCLSLAVFHSQMSRVHNRSSDTRQVAPDDGSANFNDNVDLSSVRLYAVQTK